MENPDEVAFGTTVTIRREDRREQTYRIVGEDEADPARGLLSHVSPVAQALRGRRVGEVVQAGNSEAENRRDQISGWRIAAWMERGVIQDNVDHPRLRHRGRVRAGPMASSGYGNPQRR